MLLNAFLCHHGKEEEEDPQLLLLQLKLENKQTPVVGLVVVIITLGSNYGHHTCGLWSRW
jgi:hypothetical protein